jgi:hypothetical protein
MTTIPSPLETVANLLATLMESLSFGKLTVYSHDCLTYFAVVFVILQQRPSSGEIRLERPQFAVHIASSTPGVVDFSATPIPIGQGNLRFLEQPLVLIAPHLNC